MIVLWFCLVSPALGDLLFASIRDDEKLATRISCQTDDVQEFEYGSLIDMWGSMGGQILIQAHIHLQCLGADVDGSYGNEALKYNIRISHIHVEEDKIKDDDARRRNRRKRGAKEFFQNSWNKVKKFFNKIMGRQTTEQRTNQDPESSEQDLSSLYSIPFQTVQFANGSIPEIRFSENEVEDTRVTNFKRHLADVFATRLNLHPQNTLETTVMGEHTADYNITYMGETASLNVAGWTSATGNAGKSKVLVRKKVTEEDIVRLSPCDAINNKDNINLQTHQEQIFQDGKMITSSGRSSLLLLADEDGGRRKRSLADDYLQVHTSFQLQLKRRTRRSLQESSLGTNNKFRSAPRTAQLNGRKEEEKSLRDLQNSVSFRQLLQKWLDGEQETQYLCEVIEREVNLHLDKQENSLSEAVRSAFTIKDVESACRRNTCRDYLQVMALTGGDSIEKIFLYLLQNGLQQQVLDVLPDLSKPSDNFVTSLTATNIENGSLIIGISNVASKCSTEIQRHVSSVFSRMLSEMGNCQHPLLIDILEAFGNLRSDRVTQVLQVCRICGGVVRIACTHAFRHYYDQEDVQEWAEVVLRHADCDVLKEMVTSIVDTLQDQEKTASQDRWPLYQFNGIDSILEGHLSKECCREDVLHYFRKKKNKMANTIARGQKRQKRGLKQALDCEEWTEDSRYTPIQKKEEFESDRNLYNRRKSCLTSKRIGIKSANAEIYAGMFAGVRDADPPDYKFFTKFVSALNFLKHEMEVGSFYFYLHSGNTKAYVRILGQTRQELRSEGGCTPTELQYHPLKHIPLYLVSIANIQFSLGIHLSSRIALLTECPGTHIYSLQPLTQARIGGLASGTALFAKGTASLGANFNYKFQFTFTPSPNMCLTGSHGFDPMNISFESYFQLWNKAKEDWGKVRAWKPNFLSWEVKRGRLKRWFNQTCILDYTETESEKELE